MAGSRYALSKLGALMTVQPCSKLVHRFTSRPNVWWQGTSPSTMSLHDVRRSASGLLMTHHIHTVTRKCAQQYEIARRNGLTVDAIASV